MKKLASWHVGHWINDENDFHLALAYAITQGTFANYDAYKRNCREWELNNQRDIHYMSEEEWIKFSK